MSKETLMKLHYAELYTPSLPYYVVFDIAATEPEEAFQGVKWNLAQMADDSIIKKGHLSAEPEGVSMATLMKYVNHNQK